MALPAAAITQVPVPLVCAAPPWQLDLDVNICPYGTGGCENRHQSDGDCEYNMIEQHAGDADLIDYVPDERWEVLASTMPQSIQTVISLHNTGLNDEETSNIGVIVEQTGGYAAEQGKLYLMTKTKTTTGSDFMRIRVYCPSQGGTSGDPFKEWNTTTGGPMPSWYAPADEECLLFLFAACGQDASPAPQHRTCQMRAGLVTLE